MLTENQIMKLLQEPPKEVYLYSIPNDPRFEGDLNAGFSTVGFTQEEIVERKIDTLQFAMSSIVMAIACQDEDNYLAQKKEALKELPIKVGITYEYYCDYIPDNNIIGEDNVWYSFCIGEDKYGWVNIWLNLKGEQSENEYTPHLS